MKAMALLPAAAAAILALGISTASSQQACMQEYVSCMDHCASRQTKAIQDTCFQSCETKNNMCAERVYGRRPVGGVPATAQAPAPAKDALAKKEQELAPPQAAAEPAPAPEAAPEPAPAPAPAQKRAPRR